MNENIQKLCKELLHYDDMIFEWDHTVNRAAEAIVRDCIDQCENVGKVIDAMYDGEKARRFKAVADNCAEMIRLRFGIEP